MKDVKGKSPAFQFYPNDYLGSMRVSELSLEEEGAYLRALCYCWNNGNLPCEPSKLARIIGKNCTVEIAKNISRLFVKKNKILIHERLEQERIKQQKYSKQAHDNGLKGAQKRWGSHSHPNGVAIDTPMGSDSFAASSSISASINNTLLLEKNKLMQLMRENAQHKYTSRLLSEQADEFILKYRHVKIDSLPALVRSWMKNLTKEAAQL